MNQYQQSMDFYRTGCRACFGIAIAALIIALILFFVLDIRTIFMIRTGRAQHKMKVRTGTGGRVRTRRRNRRASGAAPDTMPLLEAPCPGAGGSPFVVIQKEIIIHTEEKIPL